MFYTPRFEFRAFESFDHETKVLVLAHMLDALIAADVAYLRAHPATPLLYGSGVRYLREPPGTDNWQDIPRTLELKSGDCEDLAAWRAAELIVHGDARAHCELRTYADGGVTFYHVITVRGDGTPEDPSRIRGMR